MDTQEQKIHGVTQPLVFRGHYALTVLRGSVSIGGITLVAGSGPVPVSCPSAPYFAIKPQFSASSSDFLPEHLAKDYTDIGCIIEVEPQNLMHLAALAPPYKSLFEPLQQLSSATDPNSLWAPLPTWTQLSLARSDRMVIVGPKNSGKSSLGRYLANQFPQSYILDLDPGQCEFTPPGTLALAQVVGPNLAASYLRGADFSVVQAQTLGYVSPMDTPGRYLDICKHLLESYPGDAPLVVNTPGWTKGLGLELVREIIYMVNATKAVHMGHDESYQELQESLLARMGLKIDIAEPVESPQTKFSASDLRNLQTVCYFNAKIPEHITHWAPFELELDSTNQTGSAVAAIAVLDSEFINPEDYRTCVEGTIVAINQLQEQVPIETAGAVPFLAPAVSSSLCEFSKTIGYAVVQKFTAGGVRILTSLDPSLVTGSIVLVRGRLDIPMYLLWDQETQEGPWLASKNPPGVGSVYTKFRRNIGRT